MDFQVFMKKLHKFKAKENLLKIQIIKTFGHNVVKLHVRNKLLSLISVSVSLFLFVDGFICAKGRGLRGENWELGISRCKLLCIGWVNKVLLCSTGNHIQSPVINHSGKEY